MSTASPSDLQTTLNTLMEIEKDPKWCEEDQSGLGSMIFWYC